MVRRQQIGSNISKLSQSKQEQPGIDENRQFVENKKRNSKTELEHSSFSNDNDTTINAKHHKYIIYSIFYSKTAILISYKNN